MLTEGAYPRESVHEQPQLQLEQKSHVEPKVFYARNGKVLRYWRLPLSRRQNRAGRRCKIIRVETA